MAIVHRAELTPSKIDLVRAWLPAQDWFTEDGPVEVEASFRLDDPAGEVGIETFVVRSGPFRFHVPLTYRAAPLAAAGLVGELEHSVLGHRWVYDGASDPVYVEATTVAIVAGGRDVEMYLSDGTHVPRRDTAASAVGSGVPEAAAMGALVVARALPANVPTGVGVLTATWRDQETPLALAWLAP